MTSGYNIGPYDYKKLSKFRQVLIVCCREKDDVVLNMTFKPKKYIIYNYI